MKKNGATNIISNTVKTLLLPIIVYVFFTCMTGGRFGTWTSMGSTLRNACQAIILSWGIMFIIAANMWDFSAGAQMYLSSLFVIGVVTKYELGPIGMLVVLIIVNVVLRVAVACIYTLVHVKSMVVTLALCMILESIAKYAYGSGMTLRSRECLKIANEPWCYILVVVTGIFTLVVWNYSKFAYHIRALGAGERVARNIGLDPAMLRFKVFVIQGIYIGVSSALMLATRGNIFSPTNLSSATLIFNALMASFIGQALEKYSNRIIGVAIGTIVMNMLTAGLLSMGINSAWQTTITGLFMALFIGFSINQQRIYQYFDNRKRAQAANEKFRQIQTSK